MSLDPVTTENNVVVLPGWSSDLGRRAIFLSFPARPLTDDEVFESERAAFIELQSDLMFSHAGEYVAIHKGKPVAFGQTDSEVAHKFFREHPDAQVYIGFIGKERPAR